MRRIGTTTDGDVLVQLNVNEMGQLRAVAAMLMDIADTQIDLGPLLDAPHAKVGRMPVASKLPTPAPKKSKDIPAGHKVCHGAGSCGKTFPAAMFYNGQSKCKPCFNAYTKKKKLARLAARKVQEMERAKNGDVRKSAATKPQHQVIRDGVRALRYGPQERDSDLDRPLNNGRVMPVGIQD